MTVGLECAELVKTYPGHDSPALGGVDGSGVSVVVEKGEFFALLGPSGCGKTTLLKLIGGFLEPDRGAIVIDGTDVARTPPFRRPTNTVFQSYALFPHMKLGANVAFGLEMAGVRGSERTRRTGEALALVGLAGWEQRRVSELSGGQQQRAALARALVNRPSVLLLDEPLGALDLRLRRQMQEELVALKGETATTFVHVTHDQEEACAVADRIAVMNRGRIVQVDSPRELYRAPRTSFVAEFIDAGNVFHGDVVTAGRTATLRTPDLEVRGTLPAWSTGAERLALVLPHDRIQIEAEEPGGAPALGAAGVVERVVFTGTAFNAFVRLSSGREVRAVTPKERIGQLPPGTHVHLLFSPEDVIVVEDDSTTDS